MCLVCKNILDLPDKWTDERYDCPHCKFSINLHSVKDLSKTDCDKV